MSFPRCIAHEQSTVLPINPDAGLDWARCEPGAFTHCTLERLGDTCAACADPRFNRITCPHSRSRCAQLIKPTASNAAGYRCYGIVCFDNATIAAIKRQETDVAVLECAITEIRLEGQ